MPQGVFVRYHPQFLRYSNELAYGCYFPTTRAASRAIGYDSDRVGDALRKSKGTKREGRTTFIRGFLFITVECALKGWIGLNEAWRKNPEVFEQVRLAKAAEAAG
jgi:hypothetical protein